MKNEEINNAVLKIYDNKLFLDCNTSPVLIHIKYEGKIFAESKLPNGFLIMERNNEIFIIRFKKVEMPETILEFTGQLEITRARVYDESKKSVFATVEKLSHKYLDVRSNWGDMESTWVSLYEREGLSFFRNDDRKGFIYDVKDGSQAKLSPVSNKFLKFGHSERNLKKSIIVSRNLKASDIGTFYINKNEKYDGDMNYNSQLGFFTGKTHTKDSTLLKQNKRAKKSKIRRRK